MKNIKLKSAGGHDVIVFVDKITHMYSMGSNRSMIKLMNEEGVLVSENLEGLLNKILKAYEGK